MGEKPMGPPPADEELDPMTAAAGVNTTRSNIKSSAGAVGGETDPAPAADPIPGLDVKLG